MNRIIKKIAAAAMSMTMLLTAPGVVSDRFSALAAASGTWPVDGIYTNITTEFDERRNQNDSSGYHNAIDIEADYAANIYAVYSGSCVAADWMDAYGYMIILQHPDLGVYTFYAHCSSVSVSAGEKVSAGDVIGAVGSTGNSYGNHLHFGICDTLMSGWPCKMYSDPMTYFTYTYKNGSAQPTTCECSESYAGTYTTKDVTDKLNIRSGHSADTSLLGTIPANAQFKVTKADGKWAHVEYNGISGCVSMEYIQKVAIQTTAPQTTTAKATTTTKSAGCSCSASYAGTYTTKGVYDVLNIRADHSASSKLLGTIPANAQFKVTKADGKWAHVEYNGISGCVSMEYIQKVATQTTAPQTTTAKATTTTKPAGCSCSTSYAGTYTTKGVTDGLNIRADHSANSKILGSIPANAKFKVTKADGKWAHVEYNGISGCVSMEYIQKVATQTTAPQTTTAAPTTTTKPAGCSCSASYAGTYTTKGVYDALNIRADHSASSKLLGTIPANAKFKVTKADGKWAHVEYNGISGCVSMEYIQKVATQTTAPQTTTAKATTTTKSAGCSCSASYAGTYTTKGVTDGLNIRADHSTNSKILGSIPANAKFKVTKADGKWAHVEYNGISGCVSMEYIQKVATQTTAPQTTTAKATTTTKSAGCSCSTSYAGTYTTKGVYDVLNIRADHSASSKLLGTIPANAKFKVTKADGKWAHVEYNGISGCVSMEYIQKVATQTTAPQTTTAKATTTTKSAGCSCSTSYAGTYTTKGVYDALNIRADHSANSKILGTIPANAKFKVTKADGKWAHVEYNGISGCVSMEYIQKVATQTTAPQTTTAKATTTTKSAGCSCSTSYAGTYTTKGVYDVLNIRADHSASSKLLGTIPANAKFKVTKADGKWAHVEYNGISGCVSMEYIQKVATQTTAPQTTTAKATTTTKSAGCSCSTSYAGTYTTKGVTDGLNIRADHSASSKLLGTIPANAKFKVTKADGKWAHVEYNGISGCVSMEYIQKVATQTTAPQTTTAKATTTTKSAGCSCSTSYAGTYTTKGVTDGLNIRADHSINSKILGSIPANAKFKVTKADGKWAHVEYNGISGCVSMEYIQKVAEQTTAPQTTTAKATTTTKSAGCSCSASYAGTYTTKGVTDGLNIRADHSTNSKILGSIPANAKFKVTKADGKWAHVEYNGISGCVSMEYIQKVASAKVVGDINADGVVTISDAVILEAYLLKKRTITQEQYNAADLDGDNKVNVYDMVYMRKKLV